MFDSLDQALGWVFYLCLILSTKPDPRSMHRLHAHGVVLLPHGGAASQGGGVAERHGHVGGGAVPDGRVDEHWGGETLEVC